MNKREPAKRVGTEARLSKWAALMPEQHSEAARRAVHARPARRRRSRKDRLLNFQRRDAIQPPAPSLRQVGQVSGDHARVCVECWCRVHDGACA